MQLKPSSNKDLNSLLQKHQNFTSLSSISKIIYNKTVVIIGAGSQVLEIIKSHREIIEKNVCIAADGATTALLKQNILPEIIVTDLDGNIEDQIYSNKKGSIIVVHAHGDNIQTIKKFVPIIPKTISGIESTTKSKINIIRLLEIFFDNWKSDKNIWLWSEAAEKSFYQTLKKELEDKFKNIITENSKIAEKIKVLKEIISFLDEKQNIKLDLYKQDKESSDYFNKRNTRFEKKYNELTVSSRFMLLLHHVAHSDKLKIAEFFELEDDISALRGIHESKLEMMKGIMNDTMLELYNDKTENFE